MASNVTDSVPAIRARIPYCSLTSDVGRQLGLVKNSTQFNCEKAGTASTNTKIKIATTKMIALHPQIRMIHSITGSARSSARASPLLIDGRPSRIHEYPLLARLIASISCLICANLRYLRHLRSTLLRLVYLDATVLSFGSGTNPTSFTIFCPSGPSHQSMKSFTTPVASPGV